MPVISNDHFASGFLWKEYIQNSEKNLERFNENYEKMFLNPETRSFFASIRKPLKILILAEDLCGDVVQSLPPIIRMLELSQSIDYRIFRRDENPDLMNQYLTEGSKAIPYLVFMDSDFNDLARWGPRPEKCQSIMRDNKGKISMDEIYKRIRSWYGKNGNEPLVSEIMDILKNIA